MSVVNISASRNLPESGSRPPRAAGRVPVEAADAGGSRRHACGDRAGARRDRGGDSRRELSGSSNSPRRPRMCGCIPPPGRCGPSRGRESGAGGRLAGRAPAGAASWCRSRGQRNCRGRPSPAASNRAWRAPIRSWACRPRSGSQVICALVVDCGRLPRRWPALLVERLQLLARDSGVGPAARPSRDGAARECHRHRTAQCPARGGQRISERRDQELPRLRRHRRRKCVAASRAGAVVAGRAHQLERVAARADRHRQGAVRPRVARAQPAPRASAGAGQLRGVAAVARRKRAVRP